MSDETDYDVLVVKARREAETMAQHGGPLSAYDLLLTFMGWSWPHDGLYLCEKGCGITYDAECDYGGWHGEHEALLVHRADEPCDRLAALETVAEVARRAVDAIDEKEWSEASPIVAELETALVALGGSPTEDPAP